MVSQWSIAAEKLGTRAFCRFTQPAIALDEINADEFSRAVHTLVDELKPTELLFDFGAVTFISSITLGVLLSVRKKLLATGATLTLYDLRPEVFEIFQITHLASIFHVPPPGASDIRKIAYMKWEAAGKPAGDGLDFWLQAEQEARQAN